RAYELWRREVAAGRQAFVICPLIEESETLAARSATAEAERLRKEVFPEFRLDLVHGRLKEKDDVMRRFVAGEIQVLVATAVVEVGVDVPNATVMMIEGADRFGLAQLHQFRGRVGRGTEESWCFLFTDAEDPQSLKRLQAVVTNQSGFDLAEIDLELRGWGYLAGYRQHGQDATDGHTGGERKREDEDDAEKGVDDDYVAAPLQGPAAAPAWPALLMTCPDRLRA